MSTSTAANPPPAGNNRSETTINLCIGMVVLATIAIILRFWSRAISHGVRFWWDDWTALAALPFTLSVCALVIAWARNGLGQHTVQVATADPQDIDLGLRLLIAGAMLYDTAVSLAKFSALFFYLRVFRSPGNRWFQISVWTTFALAVAWLLYAWFITIFQCQPIAAAWTAELKATATCVSPFDFFSSSAISNLIIDVVILILPLPMLWRLQMKFAKKLLIAGVFVCGYCVVFMSVGRLVAIAQVANSLNADFTWNVTPIIQWTMVEPAIAVVSICLPAIFHLVKRTSDHGSLSLFTTRDVSKKASILPSSQISRMGRSTTKGGETDSEGFVRLRGQSPDSLMTRLRGSSEGAKFTATAFLAGQEIHNNQAPQVARHTRPEPEHHPSGDIPLRSIHVRTDVEISEDAR
ncbi:MAG: hypothetical protein M1828_003623 [Chrysothrix sp. TS-e1954]|nr:MAG: hypothetical protein M1828_003623 [Chrysothrix sp. TS-e1954]